MPGVKKPRRRATTFITYRPPFKSDGGMVTDAGGYVVAQFSNNEQILIGKGTVMVAAYAVARALNDLTAKEAHNG